MASSSVKGVNLTGLGSILVIKMSVGAWSGSGGRFDRALRGPGPGPEKSTTHQVATPGETGHYYQGQQIAKRKGGFGSGFHVFAVATISKWLCHVWMSRLLE